MLDSQVLIVTGVALIGAGLFPAIGWLACPVLVGVIALVYAIAVQP